MNTVEVRILLVDDHQMLLRGLRQLIETKPGLTVAGEALNGKSALEQVRTSQPHLVLMDVHLAGESGVETTRHILAEYPAVKVIALSGDSELALVFEALRAGVSGYILKENGPDELFKAIYAVMDKRLYLSPEIASEVIRDLLKRAGDRKPAQTGVVLTDRERLLLQLIAEGKRSWEIAEIMALAVKSVETYRSRLLKRLGCASTIELVRYAIREGIIQA